MVSTEFLREVEGNAESVWREYKEEVVKFDVKLSEALAGSIAAARVLFVTKVLADEFVAVVDRKVAAGGGVTEEEDDLYIRCHDITRRLYPVLVKLSGYRPYTELDEHPLTKRPLDAAPLPDNSLSLSDPNEDVPNDPPLAKTLMADGTEREYRVSQRGVEWAVVYDRQAVGERDRAHREGFRTREEALKGLAEIYFGFPRLVDRLGLFDSTVQAHYDHLVTQRRIEQEKVAEVQKEEQRAAQVIEQARRELTESLPKYTKKGQVTLACADGDTGRTVTGVLVGPFVVHCNGGKKYSVTHRGTGMGVGMEGLSRGDAILIAHLLSLRGDWNIGSGEKPSEETLTHHKRVKRAVRNGEWEALSQSLRVVTE